MDGLDGSDLQSALSGGTPPPVPAMHDAVMLLVGGPGRRSQVAGSRWHTRCLADGSMRELFSVARLVFSSAAPMPHSQISLAAVSLLQSMQPRQGANCTALTAKVILPTLQYLGH